MITYPYPILKSDESSYKTGVTFDVHYETNEFVSGKVRFLFSLNLTSKYLLSLIASQNARFIAKVQSDLFCSVITPIVSNGKFIIDVSAEKLKQNDMIVLTTMVVLSKDFEYKWNDELLPKYPQNMIIHLKKNDVLAISNVLKFDYSTKDPDFIRFKTNASLNGKGIQINLRDSNYILVEIGSEMDIAYTGIRKNRKLAIVFGSHIIFEALVYALLSIVQDYETYAENTWFQTLDRLMSTVYGDDLQIFSEDVNGGDGVELQKIYDTAQLLMNNMLETSLINVSKMEAAE